MCLTHYTERWARLSVERRRRYVRLIAHHVRRAQRWASGYDEHDLEQEIEWALWMPSCTWNVRGASRMQFSTYLYYWHLAKRLGRAGHRTRSSAACQPLP